MADSQFPWDEMIEHMTRDQRVVPILGPELCPLPSESGATFEEVAAKRLAERATLTLDGPLSLARLAQELISQGRTKAQLCRELAEIHRDVINAAPNSGVPEPLRQLAEIRDFPLVLTTTPDALMAMAIKANRERDAGPIAAALNDTVDLPRNWAQGPKPTLFHLFGRISCVPSFSLTEEDTLEFIHRLQSDAYRPEQLFDELRSRHLLLIGVRFTNWLMRMFLRTLHGSRLSDDTGQIIMLAGDVVRRDAGLLGFLREVSQRIWIYEEGSALDFVRELHKRWSVVHDESWATTLDGEAPIEPEPMPPGAVYVSCARADRPAAERFAAVLDEAGLDAWFDRNEIQGGARYENRVRQNIQRCDLFVPLISRQTETQADGFFRREWEWAIERMENLEGGSRFVVPALLEDGLAASQLPPTFRKLTLGTAPAGQPSPDLLRDCINAVRQQRSRRNV
jgi:TIR domain/SIR2-like domain